jgi:hypothetical protein
VAKDTPSLSGYGWAVVGAEGRILMIAVSADHRQLVGALKRHLQDLRYKYEITPRDSGPAIFRINLRPEDRWDEFVPKVMLGAQSKLERYLLGKAGAERRVDRKKTKSQLRESARRCAPNIWGGVT